jgi:hypothetical protein
MPSRIANSESLQSKHVARKAVEVAGGLIDEREASKRPRQNPERSDVRDKSYEYARRLWKLLVKNVGDSEAKKLCTT